MKVFEAHSMCHNIKSNVWTTHGQDKKRWQRHQNKKAFVILLDCTKKLLISQSLLLCAGLYQLAVERAENVPKAAHNAQNMQKAHLQAWLKTIREKMNIKLYKKHSMQSAIALLGGKHRSLYI